MSPEPDARLARMRTTRLIVAIACVACLGGAVAQFVVHRNLTGAMLSVTSLLFLTRAAAISKQMQRARGGGSQP